MTVPNETDAGHPLPGGTDAGRPTGGTGGATGGEDRSGVTAYRWTCPLCGDSRTGLASGEENPAEKAAFSLRQHVRTSVDRDHGPANAFPSEFDPDAVGRAVSVD